MKKLTVKEELFCLEYIENGGNGTKAYQKVYDVKEPKPRHRFEAYRLLQKPHIADTVKDLRVAALSTGILSIIDRKRVLTYQALSGDVRAVDILNKMEGLYSGSGGDEENIIRKVYIGDHRDNIG